MMSLLPASSVAKGTDVEGAMQPCGHQSSDCTHQHGSAGSSAWLSADLAPLPGAMWVVVLSGVVAGAVAMPGIDRYRKPHSELGGECVPSWAWIW